MCDPLTFSAGAGLGLSLLGTGVAMAGEQKAATEKAAQDQQNAQYAKDRAAAVLRRGAYAAGQIRARGSQIVSQERTGYAASGIDEQQGSAAAVQAATAGAAELDAKTAENNAAVEAWGHQVNARQYGQQASLDLEAGSQARAGTLLSGAGQAIGGLGGIYDNFKKHNPGGV